MDNKILDKIKQIEQIDGDFTLVQPKNTVFDKYYLIVQKDSKRESNNVVYDTEKKMGYAIKDIQPGEEIIESYDIFIHDKQIES